MSDIMLAVQLMGYGLVGVFSVLVVFYILIKVLTKVFPYREPNEPPKE